MTNVLAAFSTAVAGIAAAAAPLIAGIRIGPNRHMTGLLCEGEMLVTINRQLPLSASYIITLPSRALCSARPALRDPARNLVSLRLEVTVPAPVPTTAAAVVGSLAIILGADIDASPTVRITVVQRLIRTQDGLAPVLDMTHDRFEQGSLVCDAEGRLIGLATLTPAGEVTAIPAEAIRHMTASFPAANPPSCRGWLGVSLQPITVPDALVARAGQASGRMVVNITTGGPADKAGLRIGDVLLALSGTPTSGPQALRSFLDVERIGTTVEARLLRDGTVITAALTIGAQPT